LGSNWKCVAPCGDQCSFDDYQRLTTVKFATSSTVLRLADTALSYPRMLAA
jgi:hypothetical protein